MAYLNGEPIVRDASNGGRTGGHDPAAGMCGGKRCIQVQPVKNSKHHPESWTKRRDRKAEGKPEPKTGGETLIEKALRGWYETPAGKTKEERDADREESRRLRHERRAEALAAVTSSAPADAPVSERQKAIAFRRLLAKESGGFAKAVRKGLKHLKL